MSTTIYRVQDAEGRGPWRPGFSHWWVRDRDDHDALRPIHEEFQGLPLPRGLAIGCGTRTVEQLRRWFIPAEYEVLLKFGFRAVSMEADDVLAESAVQLIFARRAPLHSGCTALDLYECAEARPP